MPQSNSKVPYISIGQNDLSVIEQMLIHYEQYLATIIPVSENRDWWLRVSQVLRRRIGQQLLALRMKQQVSLTLTNYEAMVIDSAIVVCLTTLKLCLPQSQEVKEAIKSCEEMRKAMTPLCRHTMIS